MPALKSLINVLYERISNTMCMLAVMSYKNWKCPTIYTGYTYNVGLTV